MPIYYESRHAVLIDIIQCGRKKQGHLATAIKKGATTTAHNFAKY